MKSHHPVLLPPMLRELLSYDSERFVHCAYCLILGRLPDEGGMRVYLERLQAGVSKLTIVGVLAKSAEGRARKVTVVGLATALNRQSIRRIRVLAPFLQVVDQEQARITIPDFFDPIWYFQEYPDVARACIAPYFHYLNIGIHEGRCPAFDSDWYAAEYPDVVSCRSKAREHYERYGRARKYFPWFDPNWYSNTYQDAAASGMSPREHYNRIGRQEGRYPSCIFRNGRGEYQQWIAAFDTLTDEVREGMRLQSKIFVSRPLISVIMPVCDPNPTLLKESIESVKRQLYPRWELCIADDPSSDDAVRQILTHYAKEDARIKVILRTVRGHVSVATNSAIESAAGDWIAFLGHDDLLSEHALFWVVEAINKRPQTRMLYSDEDKVDDQGARFSPHFKCEWNPDLFYSYNMFSNLGVYQRQLVSDVGGLRMGFEGAQDYDLALRCAESVSPTQIQHIPRLLYHRRDRADNVPTSMAKANTTIAGALAINEHFRRVGIDATAEPTPYCYRARYAMPERVPLVTLIIPTRNGLELLRRCVGSILSKTKYQAFEILIVDNGSDEPETLRYLEALSLDERIRVVLDARPFNYSALNNAAVKSARGEIVGLINNDIEIINPDWLSEMVSLAIRPEVGAVGARLWYPSEALQHGGIILGIGGVAGHAHRNLGRRDGGYMARAICLQSLSAVTGACLLVRKSVYEAIGGLNEVDLQVACNDVDFCIRVREAGYRNIWTPYAELYHHESATRGSDDTEPKKARAERENTYMKKRWGKSLVNDPAYSPNLTLETEDFGFAWPPRVEAFNFGSYKDQLKSETHL
jgi:glycosyltransferase involved in cell wall biosynthesis